MSSRQLHSHHPPSSATTPPATFRTSTPPPTTHQLSRARRPAGGGFLDTNTRSRTSLDASSLSASISSSSSTAVLTNAPHASDDADAELSELVSLVLTEAERRKQIPTSARAGTTGAAATSRLTVPPTTKRKPSGSGTRPRNISPTHPFLLPWQPGQATQGQHLGVPGAFPEATLQRVQKAKEALELKHLALRLGGGENPLEVIRNRKLRVKVDVSRFEDLNAVKAWVEAVEKVMGEGGKVKGEMLIPAPPPGRGKRFKRPTVDWIVASEEALADWWWAKGEKGKDGEGERRRSIAGSRERSQSKDAGEESSTIGSEDEEYESGRSGDGSESEREEGSRHRRRRRLGRMIKSHRNKRKRKQVEEEKRKRQSIDVGDLSELDKQQLLRAASDISEHQRQHFDSTSQYEDGYDSEILDGRASPAKLPSVLSFLGTELVPSIAINLDPPSTRHDTEGRDSGRLSPRKLLLLKDRDVDDRRRSSWDGDRSRISFDKERGAVSRKVERVKTRVDKLRNEVVKAEEYMPWKRGIDSIGPSPTASSFTDSDVDDRPRTPRKQTSAPELDKRRPTRWSLDVARPELRRGHSALGGLSCIPRNARTSPSPERKQQLARERSPTKDVQLGVMRAKGIKVVQSQIGGSPAMGPPPLVPSRSRDAHRAGTSLLAAAILARRLSVRLPPPSLRLPSSTLKTSQVLHVLSSHHSELTASTLPTLSKQLDQLTTTLSNQYIPALHALADESEALESLASSEMTMTANQARRDIHIALGGWGRRGWIGWMARIGWRLAGWVVVAIMWVVWAIVVVLRTVRWSVGGVVKVARWILWI